MAGRRVIDLTRLARGPLLHAILADHARDVGHGRTAAGDETRDWGPPVHRRTRPISERQPSKALDRPRPVVPGWERRADEVLEMPDVRIENSSRARIDKWVIVRENDVLALEISAPRACRISVFCADGPRGFNPGY